MDFENAMEDKIYGYLKGLVEVPSVSNTPCEKEAADRIAGYINGQSYFKIHPEYAGQYELQNESLGRTTPVSYTHLIRNMRGNAWKEKQGSAWR